MLKVSFYIEREFEEQRCKLRLEKGCRQASQPFNLHAAQSLICAVGDVLESPVTQDGRSLRRSYADLRMSDRSSLMKDE